MTKKRADILLVEKGLAKSLKRAKTLIMEGVVFIEEVRVDKPGDIIHKNSDIKIKKDSLKYVSRGGLKLEKAINKFNIVLKDKISMDIGSSTGGFTDCMLKEGAKKVYAIDVGYGQLDWKLRQDPRVIVKERTNIRYVTEKDISEKLDFIAIDVSFISLELVLPVAKKLLSENGSMVALIKPQFEAAREDIGSKGIIKDREIHFNVVSSIVKFCKSIDLSVLNLDFSPITGAKGNLEFIAHISKDMEDRTISNDRIRKVLETSHNYFHVSNSKT